ncbi:PTS sugar transporter subunit IIA [[Clostridium] innocuum]|uniref:BglG family transcription antiterminator n=1 Tax=Clostridium innocuum TaxID=1522 RepID=UPI00210CAD33|nr:PTS sugar transporter subunit IIA [[Clostridium] innocuum]MCQ4711565.1 PTS sugar transporter subunit IIA [[Clostridium] innocuum]
MKCISQTEKKIVEFLLLNGQTPCKTISQALSVSDKTIRNEIHKINCIDNEPLIYSDQSGFFIAQNKIKDSLQLLKKVPQSIDMVLLRHLLLKNEPTNFFDIAEKFYISPTSLQNVIKRLNLEISTYQLKIYRKNSELHIEGSNFSKQQLYSNLIQQEAQLTFKDLKDFSDFFPKIDIEDLTCQIKKIIDNNNCFISPYYEKNLLINIFTIINLFDESIQPIDTMTSKTIEIKIATEIVNYLDNTLQNNLTIINMIACCLNGIIKRKTNDTAEKKKYPKNFNKKLNTCLNNAISHFGIHVENNELLKFFPDHIFNLIQRLRNGNYCNFPESNNLKDNCIYIYDIAVFLCQHLNQEFNIVIPENEVALIAIHLGFIIEESLKNSEKITIVLYSNNHPLLDDKVFQTLLEKYSDFANIITINNLYQLSTFGNADLIVSTANLANITDKKTILLNPFQLEHDLISIEVAIKDCIKSKELISFKTISKKIFSENLFFISEKINTKDLAIQFLAEQLKKDGSVNDTFIDNVLQRESLSPTCFMNSFAIPHSFQEDTIKNRIAILINKNGIQWNNQTIYAVFLIATSKNSIKRFNKLLFERIGYLFSENNKQKYLAIDSYDSFIKYLFDTRY